MYKELPPGQYFVTGTDTGIGKTFVTCHLLDTFKATGHKTIGLKPISAGCHQTEIGLRNEDAEVLIQHMTEKLEYAVVNPFAFEPPISPHIASEQIDMELTAEGVAKSCRLGLSQPADYHFVEGAGGWMCPISYEAGINSIAAELDIPILFVVGLKLGCLNHALLTGMAIQQSGIPCAGWIANEIDPNMLCRDENIQTLQRLLPMPFLGMLPHQK